MLVELVEDPLASGTDTFVVEVRDGRSAHVDALLALLQRAARPSVVLVVEQPDQVAALCAYFPGAKVEIKELGADGGGGEVAYLERACPDYLEAAFRAVRTVHLAEPPGGVLVCLPADEDKRWLWERIANDPALAERRPAVEVQELSSSSGSFSGAPPSERRRVVLAVTGEELCCEALRGVRYVVDSGLSRGVRYDARAAAERAVVEPTSRAAMDARRRFGRCLRLMPEEALSQCPAATAAGALGSDLTEVALRLLAAGAGLDLPSGAPAGGLGRAVGTLVGLGAVDRAGAVTALGRWLARLPLDPRLGRVLAAGRELGCVEDAASAVAMMTLERAPFVVRQDRDRGPAEVAELHGFASPLGDHLTALAAMAAYLKAPAPDRWCQGKSLHAPSMARAALVRAQLLHLARALPDEALVNGNKDSSRDDDRDARVVRALLAGLFTGCARWDGRAYRLLHCPEAPAVTLHPHSVLFRRVKEAASVPEFIVFDARGGPGETMLIKHATEVLNREWMAEMAPEFFEVRVVNSAGAGKRGRLF